MLKNSDIAELKDKLYKQQVDGDLWYYILDCLPEFDDYVKKYAISKFLSDKTKVLDRLTYFFSSPNAQVRRLGLRLVERLPIQMALKYIKEAFDDYDKDNIHQAVLSLNKVITRELLDAKTLGNTTEAYAAIFNLILKEFSVEYITFYEGILAAVANIALKKQSLHSKLDGLLKDAFSQGLIDSNYVLRTIYLLNTNERLEFIKFVLKRGLVMCFPAVKKAIDGISEYPELEQVFLSISDKGTDIFNKLRELLRGREPHYIEALSNSGSEEESVYYIRLLSRLGTAKAFSELKKYKDTPSKNIRLAFISGLRFFKTKESIEILEDAVIKGKETDVELAALRVLSDKAPAQFKNIISQKILSDNEIVRAYALSLLDNFSEKNNVKILQLLYPKIPKKRIIKFIAQYPSLLNLVLDELYAGDKNIRRLALEITTESINEQNKEKVLSSLRDIIYDNDEYIRSLALKTIRKIDSTMSYGVLLAALNDPDKRVQANAIEALSNVKGKEFEDRIAEFLTSDDNRQRINAAIYFAKIGLPKGKQTIKEALNSSNYLMRASAAWGLGEIGGLEDLELLEDYKIKEEKDIVLRNIEKAISKITLRGAENGF